MATVLVLFLKWSRSDQENAFSMRFFQNRVCNIALSHGVRIFVTRLQVFVVIHNILSSFK